MANGNIVELSLGIENTEKNTAILPQMEVNHNVSQIIEMTDGYDVDLKIVTDIYLMITAGKIDKLLKKIDTYDIKYHKYIAITLINTRGGWNVIRYLKELKGLDLRVASEFIKNGAGDHVAKNIEFFNESDHRHIAILLITHNLGSKVCEHIEKFKGIDHKEIALLLIDRGNSFWFENLKGLDIGIANAMLQGGKIYFHASYIKSFNESDHMNIALLMIEHGEVVTLCHYHEHFQGLDYDVIYSRLLKYSEGQNLYSSYLEEIRKLTTGYNSKT